MILWKIYVIFFASPPQKLYDGVIGLENYNTEKIVVLWKMEYFAIFAFLRKFNDQLKKILVNEISNSQRICGFLGEFNLMQLVWIQN